MSMLGTSAGGEQLSTRGRIYSGFQGLQIARHSVTWHWNLWGYCQRLVKCWSAYDHVMEMEVSVWGIRHLVGILLSFQFVFRFLPSCIVSEQTS